MKQKIHVLIIEDNPDDVILEIDELISGGFEVVYEQVETLEAMRDALKSKCWDCIISDFSLPQFDGLEALKELKASGLDLPFILVSGKMGEETAVKAMKAGAHDYIMKNNTTRLVPALERELREADIRRQKRHAEESIRFERFLLRTLIDNLPDGIYVKNTKGERILSNKADSNFLGYTSEADVMGKTDLELTPDEFGTKSYYDDLNVIQTGEPILNREEEIPDKQEEKHWFLVSKIPLFNEKGKINGLVGLSHDITDRKKSEMAILESEQLLKKQNQEYQSLNEEYYSLNEELIKSLWHIQKMNEDLTAAKNKAEESEKLKTAFLANMSHEIRTPLNAILGFSSFLKDPDLNEEKRENFIDIINSSGQQLMIIIDDIIEISRIEAGQLTITQQDVNISDLMNELFLLFQNQTEKKKLRFRLACNPQTSRLTIKTDGNRIRQILNNLLSNAIKFTPEGMIELGCTRDKESIGFYVKDTGIGIAPENQEIIFKPFRQVETTTSRNYGGNGLGLSISKAIAEKLGGSLKVESELGKGSVFTFTMPFKETVNPEEQSRQTHPFKYDWSNKTILVAEDEIFNYMFIKEIFDPTHVKLLKANNGKEAVEQVEKNEDVSLVLMDIKMPVMDGYTATRLIKEMKPDIPVIAQTAYAFSEDVEKARDAGFDTYLSKPIEREKLMKVVDDYFSKK